MLSRLLLVVCFLCAASPALACPAGATCDAFGIVEIYKNALTRPGIPGGRPGGQPVRSWVQKNGVPTTDPEVFVESGGTLAWVDAGVYQGYGAFRMEIISLDGGAWWKNVEMTAYYQVVTSACPLGTTCTDSQSPHMELHARGERHSHNAETFGQINFGVQAPPGTRSWPWYNILESLGNQRDTALTPACLGTAYHGNVYPGTRGATQTIRTKVEKEISHTAGYTGSQNQLSSIPFHYSNFFGVKVVIHNASGVDSHGYPGIKTEVWVDDPTVHNGQLNNWVLESSYLDTHSNPWTAQGNPPNLDNCDQPPYNYSTSQLLDWQAPWADFRSDDITVNMMDMSVREIEAVDAGAF
jgi:hypothetical protein